MVCAWHNKCRMCQIKSGYLYLTASRRPPSYAIPIPALCRSTSKLFQEPTAEDNKHFAQFQEWTTDAGRRITDMVLENRPFYNRALQQEPAIPDIFTSTWADPVQTLRVEPAEQWRKEKQKRQPIAGLPTILINRPPLLLDLMRAYQYFV